MQGELEHQQPKAQMKSVSRRGAVKGMIGKNAAQHTMRYSAAELSALGYNVPEAKGHSSKVKLDDNDDNVHYVIAKTSEKPQFLWVFVRSKDPLVKVC
jgi:hypothetical protein